MAHRAVCLMARALRAGMRSQRTILHSLVPLVPLASLHSATATIPLLPHRLLPHPRGRYHRSEYFYLFAQPFDVHNVKCTFFFLFILATVMVFSIESTKCFPCVFFSLLFSVFPSCFHHYHDRSQSIWDELGRNRHTSLSRTDYIPPSVRGVSTIFSALRTLESPIHSSPSQNAVSP